MRAITVLVTLILMVPVATAEDTQPSAADQLAAAQKDGNTAFLVVTEPTSRKVAEMRAISVEAQRRTPQSVVVEMDRSRPENRPIVKRYGLAGARLPLTLIIASNGAPAGGVPLLDNTLERLLDLVPSPQKAQTLLALFQRKAVFVVVFRPGMTEQAAVVAACHDAAATLKGEGTKDKATVVQVSLDDKVEQSYLKLLDADHKATEVSTHVYGLSGRKTDVIKGTPKVEELVDAAKKKAPCCPGGKCG